ncbi:ABC transporter permease [Salinactinospora qingdaonensis]|uniref:ABC transporter permease n=1 Tax=Salinactinospora qingdaonensis TaxID=702744 RepID=A0ABP7FW67_9ACTN
MTKSAATPAAPAAADRRKTSRRSAARPRRVATPTKLVNAVLGLIGIVLFLGLWEAVPRLGLVQARYLPPASEVLTELAARMATPTFWTALLDTLLGWGLGLGIAFLAAVILGFLIGSVPALRALTSSTVEFLRPIPSVALIPLAVLLWATDIRSTLLLVVYAAFWQIYIQVLYGVADIDPVAEQTARSFGMGKLARMRHITWPSALPYVLTGLRLGAAVALILAITSQLIIGTPGLGKEIAVAQASGAPAVVYALIIATGALGVIVNVGVRALERRVLHWHTSVRGEAAV